jgi:hypothetical protein
MNFISILYDVYTKYVCIIVYLIQSISQTFSTYTLPYISTHTDGNCCSVIEEDVFHNIIVSPTSIMTYISVHEYVLFSKDIPISVTSQGSWCSVFEQLNDYLIFDEMGLLTMYTYRWIPSMLSLFPQFLFGQLLLIVNSSIILPLSTTPVQLPRETKSLYLVYNINPIILPLLQPILTVHFKCVTKND